MKEATQFLEELKLNHNAVSDHKMKYLDVTNELLMKHKEFHAEPVTILQPTPSNEKVIEYYDTDSECDDEECDNIREY